MNRLDDLALLSSALAATLAEWCTRSLVVRTADSHQQLVARQTDLPTLLRTLALGDGGTVESDAVTIRAHNGVLSVERSPDGFTKDLDQALALLRSAADRAAAAARADHPALPPDPA